MAGLRGFVTGEVAKNGTYKQYLVRRCCESFSEVPKLVGVYWLSEVYHGTQRTGESFSAKKLGGSSQDSSPWFRTMVHGKSGMVEKPLPNGIQVDRDWDDPPSDPLAFGKKHGEDGRKFSFSRTTEMGLPSSLANGTCSLLHVSYMFPLCTAWSFPLIPWFCTSFPVAPGTGRNQRPARV